MIIALDFDRTLFDREAMYEFFRKNKDLHDIDDLLAFKSKLNELVEDGSLGEDFSEFLYPDTIPFLKKYKDEKLVLISTAAYSSQEKVINGTGILDYFTEVHIIDSNNRKGDILCKYEEKVVFLDDLPNILTNVQNKCKNSTVVLMDRNKVAKNKDFPIVSNLEEFEKFIS